MNQMMPKRCNKNNYLTILNVKNYEKRANYVIYCSSKLFLWHADCGNFSNSDKSIFYIFCFISLMYYLVKLYDLVLIKIIRFPCGCISNKKFKKNE